MKYPFILPIHTHRLSAPHSPIAIITKSLWILTAIIQLAGCTSVSTETIATAYQQDAATLCKAYDPESWGQLNNQDHQAVVLAIIQRQLVASLKTNEFREAIEAGVSSSFSEYHHKVSAAVSSLLASNWNCPAFDDFYLPSITVVSAITGEETQHRIRTDDSSVVYAEVFPDGVISFNRSMLSGNDSEVIERAPDLIGDRSGGSIATVIIGVHDPAHVATKRELMRALERRGGVEVFFLK